MINLRRLERGYCDFWTTTDMGRDAPEAMTDLFFEVLAEHNDDRVDIDGFTRALDREIGKRLGLSPLTVGAEVGAVMAGITRTPTASAYDADLDADQDTDQAAAILPRHDAAPVSNTAMPPSRPAPSSTPSHTDATAPLRSIPSAPVMPSASAATPTVSTAVAPPPLPPLPTTLAEVHTAIIHAVARVAQPYDLMVGPVTLGDYPDGCDWFALLPIATKVGHPRPGQDDARAGLWWILFRISRTYRQLDDATLDKVFADTFKHYFNSGRSALNIALLLREQEALLPTDTQQHLTQLQHLIRHGTGLIDQHNGRGK